MSVSSSVTALAGARGVALQGSNGSSCFAHGGAGGLGRVRVSALAEECTLAGRIAPAPEDACNPSPAGGTAGTAYVARYPN